VLVVGLVVAAASDAEAALAAVDLGKEVLMLEPLAQVDWP